LISDKNRTVDGVINPFINGINFSAEGLRVDIYGSFIYWDNIIEGRVEDANDLGTFVIDDCVALLVPKDRDAESTLHEYSYKFNMAATVCSPARILGVCLEIQVFDVFGAIKRIRIRSWELVDISKRPSLRAHAR